jgi:transcriptional regulator with XRE-family HTH domain
MLEQLGKDLKQHREKQDKTLKELSDATGISISVISRVEQGDITSTEKLEKIIKVLNVSIILNGEL